MFSDYKLDNIMKLFLCVGFFTETILNFNETDINFSGRETTTDILQSLLLEQTGKMLPNLV